MKESSVKKSDDVCKILVVEDDDEFREFLVEYLATFVQAEIAIASNGIEGIDQIQQGIEPDIVITDFMMPEMNGFDFAKKLREIGFNKPVIFVTGVEKNGLAKDVFGLGSFDFVRKPLEPKFQEVVLNAISISKLGWNLSAG